MNNRIILTFFSIFVIASCQQHNSSISSSSDNHHSSSSSPSEESSFIPDETGLWDANQNHLRTGTKSLDFYNLNDTHGSIEYSSGSSEEPGIAKISTYLKNKKALNSLGYMVTSSGDMWQGSADSNITKGALMDEWMDYEKFPAMALGNHEFDWTIDQIINNKSQTNVDFLGCNIIDKTTNQPVDWLKPYTTATRNGVHIGIIGAIGQGLTGSILATNVKDLKFDNPDSYVQTHASYLRENGADIILLLYHESAYSISDVIADNVDAVFCGHTHTRERLTIGERHVPAVQGGSNGKYVSHINLSYNFNNGQITYGEYGYDNNGLMTASDNPDVVNIKNKYTEQINSVKNVQIANNPTYLDAYEGVPHTYNKYALRYYNEYHKIEGITPFAVVTNNGRSSIAGGIVTYGDIYKALPFDNHLTLFKAYGYRVKEVATYQSSHWYIPSISENIISYYEAGQYFMDGNEYYILTIDYISKGDYYSSWMNIEEDYLEEEALPRNIFAHYLQIDYPII